MAREFTSHVRQVQAAKVFHRLLVPGFDFRRERQWIRDVAAAGMLRHLHAEVIDLWKAIKLPVRRIEQKGGTARLGSIGVAGRAVPILRFTADLQIQAKVNQQLAVPGPARNDQMLCLVASERGFYKKAAGRALPADNRFTAAQFRSQ
jgi:hypothetical protein